MITGREEATITGREEATITGRVSPVPHLSSYHPSRPCSAANCELTSNRPLLSSNVTGKGYDYSAKSSKYGKGYDYGKGKLSATTVLPSFSRALLRRPIKIDSCLTTLYH